MAITYHQEPKLRKPAMVVSWSGIGNIGIVAVDTLRSQTQARELGEVEPWDFFYPRKVIIKGNLLQNLEFPGSKFYYQQFESNDLVLFIGEEQPTAAGKMYAEGAKAYEMANQIVDVAEKFCCRRIYTSGAAVALTHHTLRPRVWAVTTGEELLKEVKNYENTILMSEIEGKGDQGRITGLNGLLLGVARKRGLEAVCLMGEVPDYLSGAPFPYPKASRSVLEVLTAILGITIDFSPLDEMTAQMDNIISNIYDKFPPEIRERLDQRKIVIQQKQPTITEDDEKWIKEHIDEFFKKGGGSSERAS